MDFTELVNELRGSTSLIEKKEVLKDYLWDGTFTDFHRYLLQETFDPKILHNVKLTKRDIPEEGEEKLEDFEQEVRVVLATIATIQSSKENKHRVKQLLTCLQRDDQLALLGVVNKKLHCGIGISTINNVVEDLIPVQKIQLANKYNPKKNTKPTFWYTSVKLDGQRVFGIRRNGEWKLYSRAKEYLGLEITTLEHWKPELEQLFILYGIDYTDGEAYNHGMKFEEIQSLVSSRVNLKDTECLSYHLFMIGKGSLKKQSISFIPPMQISDTLMKGKFKYLIGVDQVRTVNTPDAIYSLLEDAVEVGYEGIMLRSTGCGEWYDYKRSDLLLKVKTSDTSGTEEVVDCYVEDMEYGDFVIREDGRESSEWLPIRLLVVLTDDDDALQMKVGSGFSLEQRRAWKEEEDLIVGKTIEVMCQGFGRHGRMRFPRLHRIREDV